MKLIHTFIAIALIQNSLSADSLTYDPAAYTPIPYEHRSLDLKGDINLNGTASEVEAGSTSTVEELHVREATTVGGGGQLIYRINREDSSRQNFGTISLDILGSSSSTLYGAEYPDRYDSRQNIDGDFRLINNYSWTRRKYWSPEKGFSALELDFRFDLHSTSRDSEDTTYWNSYTYDVDGDTIGGNSHLDLSNQEGGVNSYRLYPDIALLLGYGRINTVTYSAAANHTLYYLQNAGGLLHGNQETSLRLAQLYEKLKRERVFDYREARIEQMSEIAKWLRNEEIVDSLSPRDVMEIYDIWQYGFTQYRGKGGRFQGGIRSENRFVFTRREDTYDNYSVDSTMDSITPYTMEDLLSASNDKTFIDSTESSTDYTSHRVGGDISWLYQTPVGMKGQFMSDISLLGGLDVMSEETDLSLFSVFQVDTRYYWYISLRTTISASLRVYYEKVYWNYDEYRSIDEVRSYLDGRLDYYFSPRLSLNGTLSYRWDWEKDHSTQWKESLHNFSAKLGVNFHIF